MVGNLSGAASVEFSTGVASFTDLSINHEGKSYVLDLEAFTVPSSRYQFSTNAEPFDVKERFLELVISQQPGKDEEHHYTFLATYPSPKPTLTLTSHLGQNIDLGEE